MPGMFQAPSGQLGRIKNPQPYFSSNIGMLAGVGPMGFNPANLFANNAPGLWIDESDITTLYQDSSGITPVTAASNPEGLVLDKHVPNVPHTTKVGTLNPAYTGSSFSCVGNTITCAAAAINDQVSFAGGSLFSTAEYSKCEVVFTVTGSGTFNVYAGNSPIGFIATGTPTTYVASTVNASNGILLFRATTAGASATFTVLSITGYPGNHLLQGTATTRPLYNTNPARATFDGVDDGLATAAFAAGTLTADMDCFVLINRNSTANGVPLSNPGGTALLGAFSSGSANNANQGVGAATATLVNGTILTGGTAVTQGTVDAALPAGSWGVLEVHDVNLSTFTGIRVSLFTSYILNADIPCIILCPAQTNPVRTQTRKWLGAKVGLSL